jgi:hypothetical protein
MWFSHVQIAGYRLFSLETTRAAKLQAVINTAPVCFYQFAYRGKYPLSPSTSGTTTNLGTTKLQQKVMIGYVCKVMTEYSQDRKIPRHASKFSHYVVNCNVMIPSNTNTTPERKKKLVWLVDHTQQNTPTTIWEQSMQTVTLPCTSEINI